MRSQRIAKRRIVGAQQRRFTIIYAASLFRTDQQRELTIPHLLQIAYRLGIIFTLHNFHFDPDFMFFHLFIPLIDCLPPASSSQFFSASSISAHLSPRTVCWLNYHGKLKLLPHRSKNYTKINEKDS